MIDETCPKCKKSKMGFNDELKEYYCSNCGHTVGAFYFRIQAQKGDNCNA